MVCCDESLIPLAVVVVLTQGFGLQAPDEYAEGAVVYARNRGKEVFHVAKVLGNGKYKLRRGDIKGKGEEEDKEFDEKDLQEMPFEE